MDFQFIGFIVFHGVFCRWFYFLCYNCKYLIDCVKLPWKHFKILLCYYSIAFVTVKIVKVIQNVLSKNLIIWRSQWTDWRIVLHFTSAMLTFTQTFLTFSVYVFRDIAEFDRACCRFVWLIASPSNAIIISIFVFGRIVQVRVSRWLIDDRWRGTFNWIDFTADCTDLINNKCLISI